MKKFLAVLSLLCAVGVSAHFQMLIPAIDKVDEIKDAVKFELVFTHPFEFKHTMQMGQPKMFGYLLDGKKVDLLKQLKPCKYYGKDGFEYSCQFKAPGDYIFYLEPAPYWEPAEEKMIIHYTKVVVDVLEADEGWDALVGLPVEIEPLVRPYTVYAGNSFRGIVRKNGKPVPFATVEIEYYNKDEKLKTPHGMFSTQVVKADQNGVFSYTIPVDGWWGFAALLDGDEKMTAPTGKKVDVELGGVIWIKAEKILKK